MLVTGIAMALSMGLRLTVLPCTVQKLGFQQQGAYFSNEIFFVTSKRGSDTLNTGELACVVLSLGVVILALDHIAIYDISLGALQQLF